MDINRIRNWDVYNQFKNYYRITDEEVDHWRSVTNSEIVVHMMDGSIMRFNGSNNTFGYLKRYDVDEHGNYIMSDNEYREAFAEKLKRIMKSERINQTRLSEETGISKISISHYITGKNLPDCRNLTRIANALGCSLSELTYFE